MSKRDAAPIVLLLVVILGATAWEPDFSSSTNINHILLRAVPLLLVAVGQTLVVITAGIDLSVGETITFAAVLASWLMSPRYGGIWVAVPACLVAGAMIGTGNALMIARFKLPPFLATLAMMFCLQGLNLNLRPVPGGFIPEEFRSIATTQLGIVPVASLIVLVGLAAIAVHISRSRFGLHMYALGGDEEKARLAGVSPGKVKAGAYVLSSILATAAGLFLAALTGSGDPNIGSGYLFSSLTATVLGGASLMGGQGTVWGALASAFVLTILSNTLNLLGVVTYSQWIIQGVVLVAAVAGYQLLERSRTTAPLWDIISVGVRRLHGRSGQGAGK